MLTPQEISDKGFVKAVFGGYDTSDVDDFLETLTADYSALYKENAILKSKIKVLVEKVEEYRSTEDAMRMALLTAQKMGEDILSEANKKSSDMMNRTEDEIRAKLRELTAKIADEEARLKAAKSETMKFVSASQELMRQHGAFLSKLEEIKHEPEDKPAPEQKPESREDVILDTARTIDSAVTKLVGNEETPQEQNPDDEGEPTKPFRMKSENSDWSDEDEPTSPRPKFDFDDLKFGKNYDRKKE